MKQGKNKKVYPPVFRNGGLRRGFTVIEMLIVGVVVAIIASLIIVSASSFNKKQGLGNAADTILSALNEARSKTLSSVNSLQYGVHFMSDRAIVFPGPTYATSSSNVSLFLPATIEASTISLSGGGSDVLFQRITGKTDQYGSVIIRIKAATTTTKTISISGVGSASVQ